MNIGAHVSIKKGLVGAVEEAHDLGCTTFQIFSRNPRGRGEKEITDGEIKDAHKNMKKYGIESFYIHTPYYTNLASFNEKTFHSSIFYILKDLEKAKRIGARGFVMHMGSHLGKGEDYGIKRVARGLEKIFQKDKSGTPILMEDTSGAGNEVGNSFESLGEIMKIIKNKKKGYEKQLKICLDTCHSFAEGYDWREESKLQKNLKEFDKYLGIDNLWLIHTNDSMGDLGSHKDRHDHLGKGKMGKRAFEMLASHKLLKNKDFIVETPDDGERIKDIKMLKKIASKSK